MNTGTGDELESIMRKISGCHRSDNGARSHEVIISVLQTCKLRGQNFSEYLRDQLPLTN